MRTLWLRSSEKNNENDFDNHIKEFQSSLNEIKTNIEKENTWVRPVEQVSWWRWILPYNMNNPKQKWDFECTYAEDWSISIQAFQYKFDAEEWNFCPRAEAKLVEEWYIKISDEEVFLNALSDILNVVERTWEVEKRVWALSKWKDLYKHISTFQKELENDWYRYFILESWGLLKYLRQSSEYANLWLNEVQLARLVDHVKADNNHADVLSTEIKAWTPFLLKKSTLSRYLQVFASTPRNNLVPFIQSLIDKKIISLENVKELEREAVRWNEWNEWEINFYEALIRPYLTKETKALCDNEEYHYSLDIIEEHPKKYNYINTAEEKKFAGSFIRESFEEFKSFQVFQEKWDQAFWFFQAAIIDYNMSVDRFRLAEKSNSLYIPQSEEYYKNYDWLNKVTSTIEKSTIKEPIAYLLDNWLHWQFDKWSVAKIAKENYHFMKKTSMKEKVKKNSSMWRFDYVVSQFSKAQKLSPMMKKLCPYIPMQETWYHNNKKSSVEASWLRQFMPATGEDYWLYPDWVDKRTDIVLATKASIRSLRNDYIKAQNNNDLQAIFKQYPTVFWNAEQRDLLITLFAINAHNCWPWHINRALKIMTGNSPKFKRDDDKKVFAQYMENHKCLWPFMFLTDHYAKHASDYQDTETFWNTKYLIEAPQYVYNILKYAQLDGKS